MTSSRLTGSLMMSTSSSSNTRYEAHRHELSGQLRHLQTKQPVQAVAFYNMMKRSTTPSAQIRPLDVSNYMLNTGIMSRRILTGAASTSERGAAGRLISDVGINYLNRSSVRAAAAGGAMSSNWGDAARDSMDPTAFHQLSQTALKVLMLAENEAHLLGHIMLGCEHILLGLLLFLASSELYYDPTFSIAAQALRHSYLKGSLDDLVHALRSHVQKVFHAVEDSAGSLANVAQQPNLLLYTTRAVRLLRLSLQAARRLGDRSVGNEHLLLGLLHIEEETVSRGGHYRLFEALGVDRHTLQEQLEVFDSLGHKLTDQLWIEVNNNNATTSDDDKLLPPAYGADEEAPPRDDNDDPRPSLINTGADVNIHDDVPDTDNMGIPPLLRTYCTDLTLQAQKGSLDPVIGRGDQIDRVVQILGRKSKNNACLVGEPGVGKTAIAEGLAQMIASGTAGPALASKRVLSLDVARLLAGTQHRGDLEERLKGLVDEIRGCDRRIILFIDEVHTLVGAGSTGGSTAMDAANLLKPALARGELQCIGATTLTEYRKHMEKDPALQRRFQLVHVPAPSVEETVQILRGLSKRYEDHHGVLYTEEALLAAAQLSDRYISDRFLPDKAIDLIDEAGSCLRMQRHLHRNAKKRPAVLPADGQYIWPAFAAALNNDSDVYVVRAAHIQQIVGAWTGIPVEDVSKEESKNLLEMEATLSRRIIGQDDAVKAICSALRRARIGLRDPSRPIASFIFCGPTGVGKTQLAKALASSLFGSEDAMVRLDMSEFMERHTVSKLIGSPPGYVGYNESGQLTEAVRRHPFTIVLLDEIEKAHPDVFNLMLQILEDGRLTDSKGRVVNFKNTLVIMTSNVGSRTLVRQNIGFHHGLVDATKLHGPQTNGTSISSYELVHAELKNCFKPEFLNRLDDIVVFNPLTKADVQRIANLMIEEVVHRLRENMKVTVQINDKLREQIVAEGFCPSYGARPLRRAITRLVEDGVAEYMLAGHLKEGDSAIIDIDASNTDTTALIGHEHIQPPISISINLSARRNTSETLETTVASSSAFN